MCPDLVCVGEVLLDVTMPPLIQGAVIHAPIEVRAGGVAVNAALAAAQGGARACVVGRVGRDSAAAAIRDALRRSGVEAHLAEDPLLATGTFVESGSAVAADRGASAALAPGDIPAPLIAGAILVSGHALLHDDTAAAARAAIERARADHVGVVVASATLAARLGRAEFDARARGASVLVANAAEAHALTGLDPAAAASELALTYSFACVTDGADGVFGAWTSSAAPGLIHVGVEHVEGRTTGAGDALAGVLLISLHAGMPPAQALDTACNAARDLVRS
ncbi:MAG: carbohydrate kinase family protein, partial [Gaiellaceae bacterium]